MDEKTLEAIKARLEAAITDDTWHSECGQSQTTSGKVNLCSVVNQNEHTVARLIPYERYAVFIANAPTDIDALVEAYEAARARIAALETALLPFAHWADVRLDDRGRAIAEAERLTVNMAFVQGDVWQI